MTAIEFENISKQYRLGLVSTKTLSHDLNRWWQTSILRKEDPYLKIGETNDRATKGESDYVWALRDINFKVEQGDVVGIIGKNGAGKSTLLKLLSRVTAPTTGIIRARGRIASLLEVGTGFHSEMTGRENIYLNGAIMGMTKQEIKAKLDEIVDFSGCERYLDTPVKRYSSGMTVRLGFAVAAHLDPEILVVDEVLAVGDAEFQKKAIGKMQDVSRGEGRTVLFVSHNMASILQLCKSGVLLSQGQVESIGTAQDIVTRYLEQQAAVIDTDIRLRTDRFGNGKIRFVDVQLQNLAGTPIASVKTGDSFRIHVEMQNLNWTYVDCLNEFSICIRDEYERRMIVLNDLYKGKTIHFDPAQKTYMVDFDIHRLALNSGTYYVTLYIEGQFGVVDGINRAMQLQVEDGMYFDTSLAVKSDLGTFYQDYEINF